MSLKRAATWQTPIAGVSRKNMPSPITNTGNTGWGTERNITDQNYSTYTYSNLSVPQGQTYTNTLIYDLGTNVHATIGLMLYLYAYEGSSGTASSTVQLFFSYDNSTWYAGRSASISAGSSSSASSYNQIDGTGYFRYIKILHTATGQWYL